MSSADGGLARRGEPKTVRMQVHHLECVLPTAHSWTVLVSKRPDRELKCRGGEIRSWALKARR
jgi:hypothetical protein